jgi:formate dehydrogenase major subunit/formate dehydrogenase alpha subunit
MMHKAAAREVRALYVMGENPVVTDPDSGHVRHALDQLDFLVVQDIFLTETASRADVVLPAASFAEKNGTFTNTERRVQRVRAAKCPPGAAQVDWRIIAALSGAMGYPMLHSSTAAIMEEIRRLTPSYANITYKRLESWGLHWSSGGQGHAGTPILHTKEFMRGKGLFSPVRFRPAAELTDAAYPLILTTGRSLWQYHSGSMTRRAPGLEQLAPRCWLEIHPADAGRLGLRDGDAVSVESRRGRVATVARVTGTIKPGVVFMPFHYAEAAANELTNAAVDPVAKIPELKVCAVRVAKQTGG